MSHTVHVLVICTPGTALQAFFVNSKKVQITKSKFVAKVRDVLRSAGYPEDQFVSQFPHRCSNYRSNGGDRRLDDPNSRTLAQHSVLTVHSHPARPSSNHHRISR